jgi:hypothetical protein
VNRHPVLIEWRDSCHWSPDSWVDLDPLEHDEASSCDVLTVAFLVQLTDDSLVLGQSITEANDGTGMFVIPRSCVTSMRSLRPKKGMRDAGVHVPLPWLSRRARHRPRGSGLADVSRHHIGAGDGNRRCAPPDSRAVRSAFGAGAGDGNRTRILSLGR